MPIADVMGPVTEWGAGMTRLLESSGVAGADEVYLSFDPGDRIGEIVSRSE